MTIKDLIKYETERLEEIRMVLIPFLEADIYADKLGNIIGQLGEIINELETYEKRTNDFKKIKKAFFEMMVPDHKSNRDKERNGMWKDFLRIYNS